MFQKYEVKMNRINFFEADEKSKFVHCILTEFFSGSDIKIPEIWDISTPESVSTKIKLHKLFKEHKIHIDDHKGGVLKIFVEQELIGSFKIVSSILKRNVGAKNLREKLFYEINVEMLTFL